MFVVVLHDRNEQCSRVGNMQNNLLSDVPVIGYKLLWSLI